MEEQHGPQGSDSPSIPEAGTTAANDNFAVVTPRAQLPGLGNERVVESPSLVAGLREVSARSKTDAESGWKVERFHPFTHSTPGEEHEPTAADHGSSERGNHPEALSDPAVREQAARPDALDGQDCPRS